MSAEGAVDGSPPKLHHVGIVVPDSAQVRALMELLGLEAGASQFVPQYEADCLFTRGEGAAVEWIVPRGGVLARFNKGMGGLHHIALEVDDLDALAAALEGRGVRLLEDRPVDAGRLRINFLPPAYTRGIIVEFVETKPGPASGEDHGRDAG